MVPDIVDRLRAMAGPIKPNVCTEAADEIERLRAGGCARDQKTTQYCAEAIRLEAEIERLRAERREAQIAFLTAHMELLGRFETVRNERDEARRLCCQIESDTNPTLAMRLAVQRRWDCFKEAAS